MYTDTEKNLGLNHPSSQITGNKINYILFHFSTDCESINSTSKNSS